MSRFGRGRLSRNRGVVLRGLVGLISLPCPLGLMALLGMAAPSHAAPPAPPQPPPLPQSLPGTVQPGQDTLPVLPAPQTPDFELTIESLRRAASPEAGEQLSFRLNGIRITGATAIPPSRFSPLYAKLVGHDVKLADIAAIADAIETAYRQSGYVLSRAYVPPQQVHDGIFEIDVVEGYVASVAVVGDEGKPLLGPDLSTVLTGYFAGVLREKPLANATIEQAMLLANDVPGRTASGVLRPAVDKPGASELVVTEKREGFSPVISIDNRTSPYAGPVLVHLAAAASPGLLAGDWLAGNFAATPTSAERLEGAVSYAFPVGAHGLTASVDASGSYGEPGATLSAISLITNSYSVGPHLRFPLVRSRARSLYFDTGIGFHAADVATLGRPYSHDDWRTFDATLTFAESGWLSGASSVALTVTQGLPIFGNSPNNAPNLSRQGASAADFTKLTVVAQRLQRLSGPFSLALQFQGQYAFAPLIAGEQIAFGGETIGRGYDPSTLLGDHGVGGSVELRYDRSFSSGWVKSVEPYLFSDTAKVWDRRRDALAPNNSGLASLGAGIRVGLSHRISICVELAKDVWSVADNDNGRKSLRGLFDVGIQL